MLLISIIICITLWPLANNIATCVSSFFLLLLLMMMLCSSFLSIRFFRWSTNLLEQIGSIKVSWRHASLPLSHTHTHTLGFLSLFESHFANCSTCLWSTAGPAMGNFVYMDPHIFFYFLVMSGWLYHLWRTAVCKCLMRWAPCHRRSPNVCISIRDSPIQESHSNKIKNMGRNVQQQCKCRPIRFDVLLNGNGNGTHTHTHKHTSWKNTRICYKYDLLHIHF